MRTYQVFRDGRSVLLVMTTDAKRAIDQVTAIDPRFAVGHEWAAVPWTIADLDRERWP